MNAAELTATLVDFDSRNPTLVPGAPGEHQVAFFLARLLETWGFRVELQEAAPNRPNVIARAGRASPGFRSLMLNGHLDVVGTESMTHPPFSATIANGNLYGRGSADMKGGIAAMCIAARDALTRGLDGELVIALVIDEEYESLGTRALLASGVRADAAVITEPTGLALCPAHRGFVWAQLNVHGRAAHGSRYDLGIDAIARTAAIISELEKIQREELPRRTHPLLGRPSLHMSTISGGSGFSTYPDSCVLTVERRTLPGEDQQIFLDELATAITRARSSYPQLDVDVALITSQSPSDVSRDAPVMQELAAALAGESLPVRVEGLSAWTDAALLNEAGIAAICFGPGDIGLAHSATEFVPLEELDIAARVLARFSSAWCNRRR